MCASLIKVASSKSQLAIEKCDGFNLSTKYLQLENFIHKFISDLIVLS